jgi:hypothetical protein
VVLPAADERLTPAMSWVKQHPDAAVIQGYLTQADNLDPTLKPEFLQRCHIYSGAVPAHRFKAVFPVEFRDGLAVPPTAIKLRKLPRRIMAAKPAEELDRWAVRMALLLAG